MIDLSHLNKVLNLDLRTPLLTAFFHVYMGTIIMIAIIQFGVFDKVFTELGLKHYAERATPLAAKWIPYVRMPLNTFVNLGYFIVGIYWIFKIHMLDHKLPLHADAEYMFYVFSMASIWYGNIQCARIVTQSHRSAVLDQWYTLPLFCWAGVFNLFVLSGFKGDEFFSLVISSLCSYLLSLFLTQGFEVALVFHISFAVGTGIKVLQAFPVPAAFHAFYCALASCCGFVGLKILDHRMGRIHPIFRVFSGHFLSKICDVLQIHFVCEFFYSILQNSVQIKVMPSHLS